jgi:pectate lyase
MHLFNNLWSNIDGRGLELSCGAAALVQGNVFQATHNALYDSDSGAPTWQFCMTGFFGTLYAPIATGGADDNQLDTSSTMNLGGQTATGDGLALPKMDGADFVLTVPVASGTSTATYRVTPAPDTSTVAADVQARAGIGHLF